MRIKSRPPDHRGRVSWPRSLQRAPSDGPSTTVVPTLPAGREALRPPAHPGCGPLRPRRPWRRRGGPPSRGSRASSASTWQYMTESARLSYGTRRWTAMSSGKSAGQARSDIETIGSGDAARELVQCCRRCPDHRRSHLRHQRRESVVVERLRRPVKEVWTALVVDRRRRHTGLDQLDPPTVHDLVVRRGRDGHGPAEVMGDAEAHATDSARAKSRRAPVRPLGGRLGSADERWPDARAPASRLSVHVIPSRQPATTMPT